MSIFQSQPGEFQPIGFDDTSSTSAPKLSQKQIYESCYNNSRDIRTKVNNDMYYLHQYDRIDGRSDQFSKTDFLENFADPTDLEGQSSSVSPPPNPDKPIMPSGSVSTNISPQRAPLEEKMVSKHGVLLSMLCSLSCGYS